MNTALEFHDSDIESINSAGDSLCVAFSNAYIHYSTGKPGFDAGDGYDQAIQLVFKDARFIRDLSECKGRLSNGSLYVNSTELSVISVPCHFSGVVRAEFLFASAATLVVHASSVECIGLGEAHLIDYFPGSSSA
jgi:hypothetical protein